MRERAIDMYFAYCDDEEIQLEFIEQFLKRWAESRGIEIEFTAYKSAREFLFENMTGYPFDLLILDIDMKGMDGMALAREIRKQDKRLPILFLTNRKEYVFEGYEVNALRYLLKPVDEEKLYPLLDEIYAAGKKQKHYLIETIAGENVKIDIEDIFYLEANGHYLTIHTGKENYELKKSLKEISEKLSATLTGNLLHKNRFVSTHRSFLVNLSYVERVQRTECVLSDGSMVPISRNSYETVNKAFIDYYKERYL